MSIESDFPLQENGYTACGWRKIEGQTWYPFWHITVVSNDNPFAPLVDKFIGAANAVDLKQLMIDISKEHPDHDVSLAAEARIRMRTRNGEVISDSTYREFYFVNTAEEEEAANVFDNLKCVDHGAGSYFLYK